VGEKTNLDFAPNLASFVAKCGKNYVVRGFVGYKTQMVIYFGGYQHYHEYYIHGVVVVSVLESILVELTHQFVWENWSKKDICHNDDHYCAYILI